MQWILDRLKEPSTWKGLTGLLGVIGISLSPDLVAQIGLAVAAVISAIEVFRAEKPAAPVGK